MDKQIGRLKIKGKDGRCYTMRVFQNTVETPVRGGMNIQHLSEKYGETSSGRILKFIDENALEDVDSGEIFQVVWE